MFKILFLGDVFAKVGRTALAKNLSALRLEFDPQVVIANGENAAGGLGLDPLCAEEIFSAGVDLITGGNHSWAKKTLYPYLEKNGHRIIRPYNYPDGAPGSGLLHWSSPEGVRLLLLNLMGRVFTGELVDCPFRSADAVIADQGDDADVVLVDFHAEASSEKMAMGWHLSGRAQAVLGTHTHVQTADERILPGGTAYITDVGMCGPRDSVIGVKTEPIIERFMTSRPTRFESAKGAAQINAVLIACNPTKRTAVSIERVFRVFEVEG